MNILHNSWFNISVPKVAIALNQDQVEFFLQNYSSSNNQRNLFIDLSPGSAINHERLYSAGLEKISVEDGLLFDRSSFIKSYVNLLGKLGAKNNTREWWATAVASKSRLTSKLADLLIKYDKCATVIRSEKYDNLLILTPELMLLYPLRCLIKDEGHWAICLRNYPTIFTSTRLLYLARQALLIKQRVKRFLMIMGNVIKQSLVLIRQASYTRRNFHRKLIKNSNRKEKYIVVKTHVYENSFDEDGQFNDAFFGRLPHYLTQKKNVLSLIHIHGDHEKIMQMIKKDQNSLLIPWIYFITKWDILKAIIKFIFWRIRIETIYFNGVDVSDIIKEEIKRTRFFFNQYLFYDSIKHFVKYFKVEKFIYTYENIPWERMSILALRQFSPDTKIIGYQHSIVPEADTGVFVSQYEIECGPMPDKILTVGAVTRDIICRYSDYKNGMVEAACALRYEYLFEHRSIDRTNSGNILLVLEGDPIVYKMVNYVLGQLWESDSFHLIIRAHPILPLQRIRYKIPYELEQSTKISISDNTPILDDLTKSDVVIYWGTTVSIEALSMGIPLIRYQMGNFLSYDPLFECNHLKWQCSESDSLIDIIQSISQLSDEEFSERARQAKKYLGRYFHPVTDSNLNKFIYD